MSDDHLSRRTFVGSTAMGLAAGALAVPTLGSLGRDGLSQLRIGIIGCGGRGTGAAANALEASGDAVIHAMGDVFADRLAGSRSWLSGRGERAIVPDERCFVGFDAYEKVIAEDIDIVILATPPHFRPMHMAAAVAAGKHVFMEKPVAVDPAGIRTVLAAGAEAKRRGLSIVAGTQRRHERVYLEAMERVRQGHLGRIVSASCYWNQGGLWMKPRQDGWSDMEWQLRNWLYFAWLSGDHIVEQHVHNLDVCNWAIGAHPIKATAMGGRETRTDPAYGHIFDHFAVEYAYPGGEVVHSYCRQQDGTSGRVEEVIHGTEGRAVLSSGRARFEGGRDWWFDGENPNPYVQEHVDLHASIRAGAGLNEARNVAEATMTAIMGRISAYSGKSISWDDAMGLDLDLSPAAYEMGAMAVPSVAVPGRTPFTG